MIVRLVGYLLMALSVAMCLLVFLRGVMPGGAASITDVPAAIASLVVMLASIALIYRSK